MKKRIAIILALTLVFSIVVLPRGEADAKSKTRNWYGKYWEYSKTAKKSISIKGNKMYLKGKWANTVTRDGYAPDKKIKKTFRLTSKTKYYLQYEDEPIKKVSKKKFRKVLYSDLVYCSVKVKSKKVEKVILSFN